jgi:glycosyltransferase involved in cell wall biosynthesis
MKKVISIVLNNFKNDSRVLKENISLQKAGYEVQVVALHEEPLKEYEEIQNISVHRVKLKTRKWSKKKIVQLIKYFEFIYKVVREYKNSDVIHCNDLNTLPIGVIIKKFFNKSVKIVYDAHEYEINDKPYENKISIKIKYLLEKYLIKYADKIITVSNSIAEEYVKLYGIEKPAIVLNTPLYKEIERKDLFRKKLRIEEDKTIFLYQGSLSEGRGIEILLEAFKTIENNKAVIVFMGYGPLEELIKEYSKKYENIYFHPAVAHDVLLDYTSSADFGVSIIEDLCLSYRYCLPNKLFEYLMAEVPVIVSNLYEMKKLVEINNIGLVLEKNTADEFKKIIKKVLKLNKVEIKKSIKKIKSIYNWEKQEKILINVYKDL